MNRKATKRCNLAKAYSEFIWTTLLRLHEKGGNVLQEVLTKIAASSKNEAQRKTFLDDTNNVVKFLVGKK